MDQNNCLDIATELSKEKEFKNIPFVELVEMVKIHRGRILEFYINSTKSIFRDYPYLIPIAIKEIESLDFRKTIYSLIKKQ